MRFMEFINEEEDLNYKKILSRKEALKLIHEDKKYSEALDNTDIYRGVRPKPKGRPECMLIDPTATIRKGALQTNWLNKVIDSSPHWKDYPKRTKSIIAITHFGGARYYGDPYLVLPENKAKLGVCASGDLWDSFSIKGFSIVGLDEMLYLAGFRKSEDIRKLNKMSEKQRKKLMHYIDVTGGKTVVDLIPHLERGEGLYDILLGFVGTPQSRGVTLQSISSQIPEGREVWTESKCLLIDDEKRDIYEI